MRPDFYVSSRDMRTNVLGYNLSILWHFEFSTTKKVKFLANEFLDFFFFFKLEKHHNLVNFFLNFCSPIIGILLKS